MYYEQYIDEETIYKEYKVFNLYSSGIGISNEDASDLIISKKWIFNKIILINLKSMIKFYLPKYCCAFLSTKLKQESLLYFGVSDEGEVCGFPYQGHLDKNIIINECNNIIKNYIKSNKNVLDYFEINIIKLKYTNHLHNGDIHPDYLLYLKYLEKYNLVKQKYINKQIIWRKLNARYNAKLSDLVNNPDTRTELINYIEHFDFRNPVIKLLRTDYKIPVIPKKSIKYLKIFTNDVYYWVTMLKDQMLNFLKTIKPTLYFKIPSRLYPSNIIMHIKPMIPYWIKYNKDINLYVLVFKFKNNIKLNIKYKNIYDEWIKCYRTENIDGPCCIPYY
jgi:hypothetical protein